MTECLCIQYVCVNQEATYPVITGCDIENGEKCQPDYTGGVHGESNKLGLVEVLRALPGLEGIPGGNHTSDLDSHHP